MKSKRSIIDKMQKRDLKVIYFIIAIIIIIFIAILINNPFQKITPDSNTIQLQLIEEGFNSPVLLTASPDGRLFVVDRVGIIKIIGQEETFLDLREKMVDLREIFDERGLLGLAFHPDFENNKRFFVYYSAPLRENAPENFDHTAIISEFRVPKDSNKADVNYEKIIMQIDEPQFNHNGGELIFGNDSYLYIALGDGGQANDIGPGHSEIGNGQDTNNLLGSILRINIDKGNPYSIPEDNPFIGKEERDEIYAYGLRNPFRMSFDKQTGRLFASDVGQNLWEEINIIEKGKNYGWNIKEGTYCFNTENPDESLFECSDIGYNEEELVNPIIEYSHEVGISVIGGYIYRGTAMPELYGKYIFGDWNSGSSRGKGQIFTAKENSNWKIDNQIIINSFILGFGEDLEGELYVLTSDSIGPIGNTGKVYKIIPNEEKNE